MEFFKTDIVGIAQALLSGFIASWIFHGLTAHLRPSPFERVVQALIFTAMVRVPVILSEAGLKACGRLWALGTWTKDVEFIWSMLFAAVVGLLVAWAANRDVPHRYLRDWGITKKHSLPSVWCNYFNENSCSQFAVLHLKANKDTGRPSRRLYGFVLEWPDQADTGHFVLCRCDWLRDDGDDGDNGPISLDGVDRILIPVIDVEMVEHMKNVEAASDAAPRPEVSEQGARTDNHDGEHSERVGSDKPITECATLCDNRSAKAEASTCPT